MKQSTQYMNNVSLFQNSHVILYLTLQEETEVGNHFVTYKICLIFYNVDGLLYLNGNKYMLYLYILYTRCAAFHKKIK